MMRILFFLFLALPALAQTSDKSLQTNNHREDAPPFGPLQFRNDSLTITGIYRNYHHAQGDLFKVTCYDWISSKTVHYPAQIDSGGRFTLTIPLPAESDISLDDTRLKAQTIGIPGQTISFEADLHKPDDIRYTGTNARLHNEIHQYFREKQGKGLPDYTNPVWFMQFGSYQSLRDTMDAAYRNNLGDLYRWQAIHHPELRTMQYLRAHVSYEVAMPLTQYLYHQRSANNSDPGEDWFRHIDSITAINGNTGHLSQHFIVVHRDIRNHSNSRARSLKLNADSLYETRIHHPREKEITEIWFAARHLSQGSALKDGLILDLKSKVKDTLLLNTLIRRNEDFKLLMSDGNLLSNTRIITQFPPLSSAEEIFRHITAPYRGKVIYLDIWGTWCSPCREMMQYMPAIKKEYVGKDVVFLYLACQSPEVVWKKTILEHKITGPAVVHYRMPDDMQALFEKKYRTTGYPSYLLIGKDGKLATTEAPWPRDAAALHEAINKLL